MRRNAYFRLFSMELRRMLRDPMTAAGLFAFAVFLALGAWLYWRALPPRPQNGRLFGEAFLLGGIIAWHTGIARDRGDRFDSYLAANFFPPVALYLAKVAAAIAFLLAYASAAFLLAVATSAGDVGYAAHYAGLYALAFALALPGIVLIELALTTRYPVPILLLLFFAVLGIYSRIGDVQALIRLLGMDGTIAAGPATARTAIALVLLGACYPLFRFRLGMRRLATGVGSP